MKSLFATLLAVSAMAPCLWDSDTLDTELRGLPEAFDLVVGRWHRHSDAYYQQRVDRLAGDEELTLAELDDLAVAYEHLDRRDDAIATMRAKAALLANTPDEEHRYRYHANLGTFFAHAGRYDEAIVELEKAIDINPDAHFGREVFQLQLIRYVAAAKREPQTWSDDSFLSYFGFPLEGWSAIGILRLDEREQRPRQFDASLSWDDAWQALGGMLRFGGLEGPELYRSLGDLLLDKGHLNLAWWAYGHAIERGHPARALLQEHRETMERHWDEARPHRDTGHVNPTAEEYRDARANADRWVEAFQRAEAAAIARGDDVTTDEALRELLAVADREVPRMNVQAPSMRRVTMWALIGGGLLVLVCLLRLRSRA